MEQPIATSIVIPSYNRPRQLADCLDALIRQEDDLPFEVVVVDDGSREPVADICARYGPQVRCIRQENAGCGAARNTGFREAAAPFVVTTDDDCRPHPGWLRALRRAHDGDPKRMVGGIILNGRPDDIYASASQVIADYSAEYAGDDQGTAGYFTGNNICCSRDTFVELGGFDNSFGRYGAEDYDFIKRWKAAGGTLVRVPEALNDHHHEMTLKEFWRQHQNYGRGTYNMHQLMNSRQDDGSRFSSVGYYVRMILSPIRKQGLRGVLLSGLTGLSQIAMTMGYLRERSRVRRSAA